jgi:lipopolysaccharide transport system permease protein
MTQLTVGHPAVAGSAAAFPPESAVAGDGRIQLPDDPLVSIRAQRRWTGFEFREIWAYRDLLYFLTWRDIAVRYKQTALGAAWAILQPLAMMLIFTLFFGRLARIPSDGIPYPIFAYAGLLPWTYFSNAVTNSGNSLVGSANLITKVYFPRVIVPAAAVMAGLVDFGLAFLVLAALMVVYGVGLTWSILMLPVLVALTALVALGIGMWMSALNVKYRDVRYALPFLIQLWMFATPVIYPSSIMPQRWKWVLQLNPLTGIIEGYRSALLGRPFEWGALGISAAVTVVVLCYAAYSFWRTERSFADII